MSAILPHPLFSAIRAPRTLSEKFHHPVCFCTGLPACPHVQNDVFTTSDNFVPDMSPAAPLDFSLAAQTERALMQYSVQMSN